MSLNSLYNSSVRPLGCFRQPIIVSHCESGFVVDCLLPTRTVPVWITNFLVCTNFLWSTTGIHFRPGFILYFRHIPSDSGPRSLLDQMHRVVDAGKLGRISAEVQIFTGSVSEVDPWSQQTHFKMVKSFVFHKHIKTTDTLQLQHTDLFSAFIIRVNIKDGKMQHSEQDAASSGGHSGFRWVHAAVSIL